MGFVAFSWAPLLLTTATVIGYLGSNPSRRAISRSVAQLRRMQPPTRDDKTGLKLSTNAGLLCPDLTDTGSGMSLNEMSGQGAWMMFNIITPALLARCKVLHSTATPD
jgi:hypothetical protein